MTINSCPCNQKEKRKPYLNPEVRKKCNLIKSEILHDTILVSPVYSHLKKR